MGTEALASVGMGCAGLRKVTAEETRAAGNRGSRAAGAGEVMASALHCPCCLSRADRERPPLQFYLQV